MPTLPQPTPSSQPNPPFRRLLWHWMMGVTLGIVFAGIVLQSGELEAKGFLHQPLTHAVALHILLTAAFLFGAGAAFTGLIFLTNEKS
jgi:hypothetical protein